MHELTAAGSRLVIEPGSLANINALLGTPAWHRATIVTDSNVGPLYAHQLSEQLSAFAPITITVPAGEDHKNRDHWARVSDEMLAHGMGRDGVVMALGGGVVGDLAGFVAATYMRGIPVVQVPTSLVAMIDASIGGKTGIDVPAGKNLVGAFHAPVLVAIDSDLLSTLPERELRSGLAEALKHGVIADREYFAAIVANAATLATPSLATSDAMRTLVARSVAIKADVVNADPREAGRRKILNFGHTLGHAIEAASGYALRHGEAIAIGMVLEARLGERLGVTRGGTADQIEAALRAVGLPVRAEFSPQEILERTYGDKKKSKGRVEYALPAELGRFEAWTIAAEDTATLSVLESAL